MPMANNNMQNSCPKLFLIANILNINNITNINLKEALFTAANFITPGDIVPFMRLLAI